MLAYDTKVIDRFWNRVSKSGDDDCWLWDNPVADGLSQEPTR